jgi:hypothetical protein
LASEVKAILDSEAASAPHSNGADPSDGFQPTVTMHRHVR